MSEQIAEYLTTESKKIHYPFYKNILESKGYSFKYYESPFDVWNDGKNEIRICQGCGILSINRERLSLRSGDHLINFLFNKNE